MQIRWGWSWKQLMVSMADSQSTISRAARAPIQKYQRRPKPTLDRLSGSIGGCQLASTRALAIAVCDTRGARVAACRTTFG